MLGTVVDTLLRIVSPEYLILGAMFISTVIVFQYGCEWKKHYKDQRKMFFVLAYITVLCVLAISITSEGYKSYKHKRTMNERFNALTSDEQKTLADFWQPYKKRSLVLDVSDPVVALLMHDGILIKISDYPNANACIGGNGKTTFAVALHEYGWNRLNSHPEPPKPK